MKVKQKRGGEKQLISKQKDLTFNTTVFLYEDFLHKNSSNFLFLGKPGS